MCNLEGEEGGMRFSLFHPFVKFHPVLSYYYGKNAFKEDFLNENCMNNCYRTTNKKNHRIRYSVCYIYLNKYIYIFINQ